MGHSSATRKRLNDTAALAYEQRTGLPSGYWPDKVEAVTLDVAGRIVWPAQVQRQRDHARLAAVIFERDLPDTEYDRDLSTDPDNGRLINLSHDEHEDFPQGE